MPILTLKNSVKKAVVNIGSLRKGAINQTTNRMEETDYFRPVFTDNAPAAAIERFKSAYGDTPKNIYFYLPYNDIDECFAANYTAFSKSGLLAASNGVNFEYIANLTKPTDTLHPYLQNGVCIETGQPIPHQPDLGFIGKPEFKLKPNGRLKVFVRELTEIGIYSTMELFATTEQDIQNIYSSLMYFDENITKKKHCELSDLLLCAGKKEHICSFADPRTGETRKKSHYYVELTLAPDNTIFEKASAAAQTDTAAAESSQPGTGQKEQQKKPEIGSNVITYTIPSDEDKQIINDLITEFPVKCLMQIPDAAKFTDRETGKPFTDLSIDELKVTLKKADDYTGKVKSQTIHTTKEKYISAQKRRVALVSVILYKLKSE